MSKKKDHFPDFDKSDYNVSLIRNLNYYSSEVDEKSKKQFAIDYWKSLGKDVKPLDRVNDKWFTTIGAVAHMAHSRGIELSEKHIISLETHYAKLYKIGNSQQKETKEKVVDETSKEQKEAAEEAKLNDAVQFHIAELEAAIDLFIKKDQPIDPVKYFKISDVKPTVVKHVVSWISKTYLRDVARWDDDPDLKEGYKNFSQSKKRKFVSFLEELSSAADEVAKHNRRTTGSKLKTTRAKPPIVMVAKMKYKIDEPSLSLKSVHPSKIIGAQTVMMYNVKTRRMLKYTSAVGSRLSVKGTTILNWDEAKSHSKIIRKPEEFMNGIQSIDVKSIVKRYDDLKTTPGKLTGRVSEDIVIIAIS